MSTPAPPDSTHFAAFFARHAGESSATFRHLLDAVRAQRVVPHEHTRGASCVELASIYEMRSKFAEDQGRVETADEMREFSRLCKQHSSSTCDFWMFSGSSESFVIFELMPESLLAWCLRFEGPLTKGEERAA